MHDVAGTPIETRMRGPLSGRGLVPLLLALTIATGLVGAGLWAAPAAPRALPVPAPCGTVAPAVMPTPACQRILEHVFLGAPLS